VTDRFEELRRRQDLQLAHVLTHYIYAKHPYSWEMRSPNARPELAPGQYWNQIIILDSMEFWRIRDRLKQERGWE